MVNATVSLPDDVASRAAAAAADSGVTVDELASEALEAYLGSGSASEGRVLGFVGLGKAATVSSAGGAEQRARG